jgi:hypothetical protein
MTVNFTVIMSVAEALYATSFFILLLLLMSRARIRPEALVCLNPMFATQPPYVFS